MDTDRVKLSILLTGRDLYMVEILVGCLDKHTVSRSVACSTLDTLQLEVVSTQIGSFIFLGNFV